MTAQAGFVLVDKIRPLIEGAVARGAVKPVGAEDVQELAADGVAIAARLLKTRGRM